MASNLDYIIPSLANKLSDYSFIDDMSGGWKSVVGKAKAYLPEEVKEEAKGYDRRLQQALFEDNFNPTINGLTGLVFKKEIVYEDLPPLLEPIIENVTTTGKHFDILLQDLFDTAMRKGTAFAYTDMQKAEVGNKADEQRLGIRPYTIEIAPENITSWKTETVAGQLVLSEVKIREFIEVDDDTNPYATKTIEQYRILGIGTWELYQKTDNGDMLIDWGITKLNFIPLVCLNLDETGFFTSRIPFYDLAKLNIAHYQVSTDSRFAAHTASIPWYFGKGIDKDAIKDLIISPNTVFATHMPDADIKIVDYDGKGVEVNSKLLDRYEKKMAEMGLSIMVDKTVTATEANIVNGKSQSKLSKWARMLQDTAELILTHQAKFYGLDDGGSVIIDADILAMPLTAQEFTAIISAKTSGNISTELMFAMIARGKLTLGSDFDIEIEKERLETDGAFLTNNDN